MSGIYIHISFCKSKCFYCDFFSVSNLTHVEKYISALKKEAVERKEYLHNKPVSSIYFGGGTPSLLNTEQINEILEIIYAHYKISECPEVTLEANPDDVSINYYKEILSAGINRLSIGLQSLNDTDLKLLNRRHTSAQAMKAVVEAQEAGFRNISVDLMYGLPGMSLQGWEENIEKVLALNVQHISAYHLSIEAGTVLSDLLHKGQLILPTDDDSLAQYKILVKHTKEKGFIHYEISNFALENYFSEHNSSYWKQTSYLGLGCAAHSYNGISRRWNVADINTYIQNTDDRKNFYEEEILSEKDKLNDYILTSLRTIWGTDMNYIKKTFPEKYFKTILKNIQHHLMAGNLIQSEEKFILSDSGKFISDAVIRDLIVV